MSLKTKRSSATADLKAPPSSKKTKTGHPPPFTKASAKNPSANKSQQKFERKQQNGAGKSATSSKVSSTHGRALEKRVRAEDEAPIKVPRHKKPAQDFAAETEWDSDPIEESETGEESGADDGVSWPSDDETGGADGYDELMEDEGNQEDDEELAEELDDDADGGVKLVSSSGDNPVSAGDAKANGTNSREAHQKQRELLKERKAAKPNADEIARSKKLWERLRRSSHVPKEERKKLIKELFDLITGRVREFVLKHDAGRVIQTALKYGTPDQRKTIARELAGEMAKLAESKYAKFMIGKLVSYGDKEIRDIVIPDFFGKVRRMIRHPEASWILDDIYRGAASKEQKSRLLREWYGAEFSLFADKSTEVVETAELSEILKQHPEKRKHVMRYLWELINQLVQKKTTGFTMLHDAMLQYYLNVEPGSEEANEFLELLKGDEEYDLMKNLAFTTSGSRVVSLAFAQGTAKDRKLLLRAYKDTVQVMAFDSIAHQVLVTACEVIDDTVLVSKSIFSELIPKDLSAATEQQLTDLVALASDANAREVILLPFVDRQVALLRPAERQLLQEIHTIREKTSKKEPSVRKRELAKVMSLPLLQLIERRAADLVQTSFGSIFITEVLTRAEGSKEAALKAVAGLSAADDESVKTALETPAGGKMMKTLVQGGRFDFATKKVILCDPNLHFVDTLFDTVGVDTLTHWATGAMAFVVLAMLETNDWEDSHKQTKLRDMLKKNAQTLQSAAKQAGGTTPVKGRNKKPKSEKGGAVQGSKDAANKRADSTEIGARGAQKILEALAL